VWSSIPDRSIDLGKWVEQCVKTHDALGNPSILIDSIHVEWILEILTPNPLEFTNYAPSILSKKRIGDHLEFRLRVRSRDDAVKTLESLFKNRVSIKNLEIRQPNLEDVFIQGVEVSRGL